VGSRRDWLWLGLNDLRLRLRRRRCLCLCGCGGPGGQRGQQLAHACVVLRDPLLELELKPRLLGHAVVELRTAVADHVADHDADEEAAENRGEAEVRRDRPGCMKGAERHGAHGRTGRRADRDTEPSDRARFRLVVSYKLSHCPLRLSAVGTHGSLIGVTRASLEELVKIAPC
jgi:hypothetical protein